MYITLTFPLCDCQLTYRIYDLEDTFEVMVGTPPAQSKRFTIHANVFTRRSGTLASLHKSKPDEQTGPADLTGEDSELFQAYLNYVYFGPDTIEQWADASAAKTKAKPEGGTSDERQAAGDLVFERLVGLYLLAERLVDFRTADAVIDEIIRARDVLRCIPTKGPITLAYASTAKGSPLRTLLRDFWTNDSTTARAHPRTDRECLREAGFPLECLQDIAVEALGMVREDDYGAYMTVKRIYSAHVCHYHQHDELHPRCLPVEPGMCDCFLLPWETLTANTLFQVQTLTIPDGQCYCARQTED